MIVSGDQRYAFLHVPKTGGLSIRRFLAEHSPDVREMFNWHISARDAVTVIHNWTAYFSFGFVRNPWAAQLSLYKYVLAMGPQHPEWAAVNKYAGFSEYVDRYLRRHWELGRLMTQTDFLCDFEGRTLVTFVGRFETLRSDFDRICQRLGFPSTGLPWLNRSENVDYRDYYDLNARYLVEDIYSCDLETFGYSF